jgi:hypothetical protein
LRLEFQGKALQLGQHCLKKCHQLHCQPLCLLHLRLKVQENALKLGQHCLQQIQIFLNFSHGPSCHQLYYQPLCLMHLRPKVHERVLQLGQYHLQQVQILLNLSHCLLIINCTVNFFVYFTCRSRFRRKLFNLVNSVCNKIISSWIFIIL